MKRRAKKRTLSARRRPGALELLGGGILLFLLLAGALLSFATAVGQELELTTLLGGLALLALVYTLLCALPARWMLPAMALILVLTGLAVWRLETVFRLGEITYRCAVVNTVCTSLELDGFIQPILQLPDPVWVRAATVLTLAVAAVLGAPLALAAVRLPSLAVCFLLTGPFVLAPLCISVTPAWLPLMGLVLAWCVLGLGTLARRWDRRGAARLTLAALPASALLLLLLSAAMPQAAYQRPGWADDALDSIQNWATHLDIALFDGRGPFGLGGGGSFTDADGKVSLDDAGPLNYSGRTVLEVDTDLRGRIYLRGFSSAVYGSDGWGALEDADYSAMFSTDQDPDVLYDPSRTFYPTLEGWQPMNFPALSDRESFPDKDYAKVTVRNVGADPGYVYVPYHILSQPDELSGAKFVNDAYLARGEDVWTHTLYVQPGCDPMSESALPEQAQDAEFTYSSFVYDCYTAVPLDCVQAVENACLELNMDFPNYLPGGREGEVYEEFEALLDRAQEDPSLYSQTYTLAMAKVVTAYLADLAEYDPDTPVTPEGEDFVSYFLTESHEGYCMHFASAATLMLRYMGFPARYVTGYVADVPSSGHVNVPDSAAHAWVEVYIGGYGWEPIEVTPAYAGSNPGQSGTAEPTPTPTATPTPTPTQTAQPSARPSTAPDTDKEGQPEAAPLDLRFLLIPLAVVLVVLAFPARRAIGRARREKRFRQGDTNRAVIAAYLHLKKLERWGGQTPEEVFELAKKARFSPHTLTEEERQTATAAARAASAQVDKALPWYKRFFCRYILGLC